MGNPAIIPPQPSSDMATIIQVVEGLRSDVREDLKELRQGLHEEIQENTAETREIRQSVADVREKVEGLSVTVEDLKTAKADSDRLEQQETTWHRIASRANRYAWVAWPPAVWYIIQLIIYVVHHG